MAWEVSDDYRRAVAGSHKIATRVEVLRAGSTLDVLKVSAGAVQVDGAQAIRRTLQVPLVDYTGELVPGVPEDLLHVVGNELRAWRGVDFGDDRSGIPAGIAPRGTELVPLITGPIYENDAEDQGDGVRLSLQIYDRGRYVSDAKWTDHYIPNTGDLMTDAIMAALVDRLPATLTVRTDNVDVTTLTVPHGMAAGNNSQKDPMAVLIRWATSIGFDLAFDPLGDPVLRETPDPIADQPVATYSDEGHTLFSIRKRETREDVYNVVVVTGESPGGGPPVRAVVYDDDPTSPTYYLGNMGPKPFEHASPIVRTQDQATKAANSILRRKRGIGETVSLGTNVDGSLDAYDLVDLRRRSMKIDARYALEAFAVPLAPEDHADLATRKRRTN